MALALTPPHNVAFIHTHKTGGTWVRHALEAADAAGRVGLVRWLAFLFANDRPAV